MPTIQTSALLLEEPIRLASILEHSHSARPYTCLTKIVGTVGGNSRSVDALAALLHAGMTVARFDFSSGTLESHLETLENLKAAMLKTGKLCAVMYDTAGPEVTIPNPSGQPVSLQEGSTVILRSPSPSPSKPPLDLQSKAEECGATPSLMWLSVRGLAQSVKAGGEIFVGQYLFTGSETTSVWLKVKEVNGDDIVCEARNGATLRGNFFTVHLSQVHVPVPTFQESDKASLAAWMGRGGTCDIISLSFTRHANDILEARKFLQSKGRSHAHIYAKIENIEGLQYFTEILAEADGIILGRGDLGIDLEPERVFLFQKVAIQRCNFAGKPVVISRVVDTMTDTPRPTRAEATDVANAVLDGVDAIMLGAETLRGLYPVETVATVRSICGEAEKVYNQPAYYKLVLDQSPNKMAELESICSSAVLTAENVHASCIIAYTTEGKTARLIAKYKPTMPTLVVVVPHLSTNQLTWTFTGEAQAHQALLVRGLIPMLAGTPGAEGVADNQLSGVTNESLQRWAMDKGRAMGLVHVHDRVVVVQKMKSAWTVRIVNA